MMEKLASSVSADSLLDSSSDSDGRRSRTAQVNSPRKPRLLQYIPAIMSPRRLPHLFRRFSYGSRVVIRIILPFAAIVLLMVTLAQVHSGSASGGDSFIQQQLDYVASLYGPVAPQLVDHKKDLLTVNISASVNTASLARSPITQKMLNDDYMLNILTGFVSNLDLDQHKRDLLRQKHRTQESHEGGNVAKDTSPNIIDIKALEREGRKSYDSVVTCEDIAYNGTIFHSLDNKILHDDLVSIRREILKQGDWLTREVKDDRDKDKTEEEIITTQWYRFGGASVWMESQQCYLVFTRVIYSRRNRKSFPHISLVRAQAFDKDWNEIIGKKIPYLDVDTPDNMERELAQLDLEMGIENCDRFSKGSIELENCNVRRAKATLLNEKKKEKVMSKYYITYPTVLKIPFYAEDDLKGPEDPRVTLREGDNFEEPIIMFNMYDHAEAKRRMFTFLPHRRIDPLIKFSIVGRSLRDNEKNWTPFFNPSDKAISKLSRGFIHFIYSFSPLDIIRCSLNDGVCEIVFDANTLALSDSNNFDGMRGGTQFVKLPASLPGVRNKNMWVGFPKLHIKDCGCGKIFYRPMLDVLVESDGVYHQELVVPAIGFDIDVLSWDLKSTDCMETNILSPNSIAHWDVVGQDPETLLFDDYMTVTVSESDILTKVITLKGVLNYVLGIYRDKEIKDDFEPSVESDDIIGKTISCLVGGAEQHCAAYGKSHAGTELPKDLTPEEKEKILEKKKEKVKAVIEKANADREKAIEEVAKANGLDLEQLKKEYGDNK